MGSTRWDPAKRWAAIGGGILGIIAARLTEGWWRPVAVGALLVVLVTYLLVARPDDPAQPRLVTRLARTVRPRRP